MTTKTPFLQSLLTSKDLLEQKLSCSQTAVESLRLVKEMLPIQTASMRLRRRISLSVMMQNDLKKTLEYLIAQQNNDKRHYQKDLEKEKNTLKEFQTKIDSADSIFNSETLSTPLASYLLGSDLYINIIQKSFRLGDVEARKDLTKAWRKVSVFLFRNILLLTKPGSEIILSTIYIPDCYKLLMFQDPSHLFMIKVCDTTFAFNMEEVLENWKDKISKRLMWYRTTNFPQRQFKNVSFIEKMTTPAALCRRSISLLNCLQFSPHIFENVVGVNLHDLAQKERTQKAPLVYKLLIDHITEECAGIEGILRLSGDSDNIQRLEMKISSRTFSSLDLKDVDPHTVTSTLKSLFKNLPTPLIPQNTNKQIESVVGKYQDYSQVVKVYQILSILKTTLPEHFEVFKLLCKMFGEIINQSNKNKMDLKNVLICFVESVRCSPAVFTIALQNQGIFFDRLFLRRIHSFTT
ncbi:hypothetical protein EIN_409960 [Entamoeba invadens IP1]|uniref:Rho-GAP domain-containing protein n=1 Tax=Entamoeba invadens IP1 TaxID=370355 RepID=A0A0A1TWT5_ENTIV|nr:hypothetical protein EIN_409960 [Entamoeba invadens IP1]ELP85677.1 hypothetical protein EIN_409960 [Entamoeba invadens IP1]|eukprot:XP_004185023.1 hypothetical protein EIN_409960 [Entamoeba invadens IP1]